MEKTFNGNAHRVGTIFKNVDQNIIELANVILKMVYPDYTLIDFADPNNEPTSPVTNNCYLASATGTVWGVSVEKDEVLRYDSEAWEVLPYKITEWNAARLIGPTPYDIAVENGFTGTEAEWLASLEGDQGLSAYEVAVANGYSGTQEEWTESLIGASAYEVAVANGYSGTQEEWTESLIGASAYEVAVANGFSGTQEEWLLSLNGEVTQAELDEAILGITQWYGIEYDVTNSSPAVTRIGNTALHASLPVQSQMRGCLLNDDGTVNYYLDANDWSMKEDGNASTLDGTDGQVMVELPEYYERFETDGNIRRVKLSTLALPGFSKVPKMYTSAYEAALSRIDSKLSSVATLDTNYRGGDNDDTRDADPNSLLGKPITRTSRTNFRSYARNRGTGWEMYYYRAHKSLFWFFVVEYATRNTQAAVNNSLTAEGYRQGGLGDGVTTANSSEWSAFNGYDPFIDCGASDSLGNSSGEVAVEITDFGGAGVNRTFNVPRYRGIENPFGHIWKNTDGINIRIYANQVVGFYNTPPASPANGMRVIVGTAPTDDFVGHENEVAQYSDSAWSFYSWGADWENWIVYSSDDDKYYLNSDGAGWVETTNTNAHTSDVLTTDNPAKFTDSDFTDYILRGTLPRSSNYIQEVIFGPGGEFLPKVIGGSSSLNFCDSFYTSIPTTGYAFRTLLLGGSAHSDASAGLGYASTSRSPSSPFAYIGSRLCYLPEHG